MISDATLDPRTYFVELAAKTDPLQLATLLSEGDLHDLVDIVPETIESGRVQPAQITSLVWVMRQPQCNIVRLK